ncbi:MAG TPA: hypothetical protein VLK82_17740 [Candidatus Tectomicrobia bacterium]|nr:hypothetical protein [Candidatus Tectomicrobia bacterium]
MLLDPNDTIVLLLDHQTGLFQTVKDIPIQDLRTNTLVLAKVAEHAKAPIITTASEPNGANGPPMPELALAAPSAKYVARKGEVSAAGRWMSICSCGSARLERRWRTATRGARRSTKAFPDPMDYTAAKVAIFLASFVAGGLGAVMQYVAIA